MKIFCIDIGNTHVHFGAVETGRETRIEEMPTPEISELGNPLETAIVDHSVRPGGEAAFSFCSVVPRATENLRELFRRLSLESSLFQLTADASLGAPISYPRPDEIGGDRLANAVAAAAFYRLPCIVIDMGTAVTLDIVSAGGGYEGGVIAPGLRVMTRYLKEQTALLPDIGADFSGGQAIGKSTIEAMKIGCRIGFAGMIRALLDAVARELSERGEQNPSIVATGGTADAARLLLPAETRYVPDITLAGLAQAWRLNRQTG